MGAGLGTGVGARVGGVGLGVGFGVGHGFVLHRRCIEVGPHCRASAVKAGWIIGRVFSLMPCSPHTRVQRLHRVHFPILQSGFGVGAGVGERVGDAVGTGVGRGVGLAVGSHRSPCWESRKPPLHLNLHDRSSLCVPRETRCALATCASHATQPPRLVGALALPQPTRANPFPHADSGQALQRLSLMR